MTDYYDENLAEYDASKQSMEIHLKTSHFPSSRSLTPSRSITTNYLRLLRRLWITKMPMFSSDDGILPWGIFL